MNFFSEDVRRNPYPLYEQVRKVSPVLREPQTGLWMLFDYESVKRALSDHETFSSRCSQLDWMNFHDPPRHTKLRALVSQAFTPRSIANLEPRIRELTLQLLEPFTGRGEMDLAADFAVALPILVIAEMLGIPTTDREQFKRWNEVILNLSYTVGRRDEMATRAQAEFVAITGEMDAYLAGLLAERRSAPRDDLLTRLLQAELDGQRLTHQEIFGFFQLLLLAGSETTANLINNAILCFIENPDQLARLKSAPELLSSAIEEVLRYRSPLQWMLRVTTKAVELHGQSIPPGGVVLPIMGSANRDPAQFRDANQFDIARTPNPHVAFGHGLHFCLGAALSRTEARIALPILLERLKDVRLASAEPWEPRKGLHVHGPARLPIVFSAN
jgi:cytochrome P450